MSRPVKFRAWKKSENRMVSWEELLSSGKLADVLSGTYLEAFMQFTGLHDKNGKEVYEGDVVAASIYSDEPPQILEVKFEQGAFIIDYKDSESDITTVGWFMGMLEVIGNIYSNPELLEVP